MRATIRSSKSTTISNYKSSREHEKFNYLPHWKDDVNDQSRGGIKNKKLPVRVSFLNFH